MILLSTLSSRQLGENFVGIFLIIKGEYAIKMLFEIRETRTDYRGQATVVTIGKFTGAVLWSKTAIFREVYHNMKMPACCWVSRTFIPCISTFKRHFARNGEIVVTLPSISLPCIGGVGGKFFWKTYIVAGTNHSLSTIILCFAWYWRKLKNTAVTKKVHSI